MQVAEMTCAAESAFQHYKADSRHAADILSLESAGRGKLLSLDTAGNLAIWDCKRSVSTAPTYTSWCLQLKEYTCRGWDMSSYSPTETGTRSPQPLHCDKIKPAWETTQATLLGAGHTSKTPFAVGGSVFNTASIAWTQSAALCRVLFLVLRPTLVHLAKALS